jgi:hypothetical protein
MVAARARRVDVVRIAVVQAAENEQLVASNMPLLGG